MIFTVEDLLEGRSKPVSIAPGKTVVEAVALMTEHDFSQLPVVTEEQKPVGLITSDSILRAANHCGVLLNALKVSDAFEEPKTLRFDGDLFELLDEVQRNYAVLIVDAEERLTGIVTHYDTSAYFRRRAEDMMVVEDIETTLKEYILAIYRDSDGKLNGLRTAINEVTNSGRKLRKKYEAALRTLLNKTGQSIAEPMPIAIEESFKCFGLKEDQKDFDELSFDEFTAVLLRHEKCPKVGAASDSSALLKLLNAVRDTRNTLAHFRGEITVEQRDQLRFCSGWLSRAFVATQPKNTKAHLPPAAPEKLDSNSPPTEEDTQTTDSMYAPLAAMLATVAERSDEVWLTFDQIEGIINHSLPQSAREHRAWWANNPGHTQARQWLGAGWKVKSVSGQEITFSKVKEREEGYIDFFSGLVAALRQYSEIHPPDPSPKGLSYFCCAILRGTNKRQLKVYASFSRSKGLRIELYIDVGSKTTNKAIFQILFNQKDTIERIVGEGLSWERLETRSAARIALYHPETTNNQPDKRLIPWATNAVVRMVKALSAPTKTALDEAGR